MSAYRQHQAYASRPAEWGTHACALPDPNAYRGEPGTWFPQWLCLDCGSFWTRITDDDPSPHPVGTPWAPARGTPSGGSYRWKFEIPQDPPAKPDVHFSDDRRFYWTGAKWLPIRGWQRPR